MKDERLGFRIDSDKKDRFSKAAELKNLSLGDWMIQAATNELTRKDKQKDMPNLRPIILSEERDCIKCDTTLPIVSRAWFRGGVTVCEDCYTEAKSPKALVNRKRMKREFDKIKEYASEEIEKLMQKWDTYDIIEALAEQRQGAAVVHKKTIEYIDEKIFTKEDRETIQAVKDLTERENKLIDAAELVLRLPTLKKLKKLRKQKQVAS